ncbi:cation-transporting P-type ATPase [Mycobacterium ulcerans]|uniref:Metal cation-transporting P-type ATPase F, CtpF n=1 Tax=Mycobacterium ulcerans (strain Agy99) TaxID=362242 RepID=A0PLR5_MYCUA|nr:cation-transporting P-type ATPase [Mycobacterium ulcerans]ABL03284.1 metal cation-transporting p-type ATPase F, CtpF [Mycobacterium ulcerans Agy99]MEB3906486.1 cation-transporting P-type ATPase [Mycobacterium ulcerans]MEB3910637.1 cation-transporting P-type ATPase [Mycobacterium ulcerans]MEB3920882.1 cation-transporting P-type ATPase [Mycobacterium ulcerans]MEB3924994.1 cation-transporting P-type ATPase [Mycobacterium ulcerans]
MSVSVTATAAHHGLPAHEVVLLLETDPHRGLSDGEAAERLQRFGPNALPLAKRGGLLLRILRQFHHPLIYVLLVAGAITAGLQEYIDSSVIFGVVVLNAIVGFIQESKAESALEGLRSMVRTQATVIRDGHEHTVASEDLVTGDLVLLESGDKVPADLRLVRATELHLNESALTGESAAVHKSVAVLPEATPVADRLNMVYSGTLVTAGRGAGIAVATGAETELGEIHRLVGAAETLMTPLTAKLAWFSKVLTIAILGLAAVTFAVGLLRLQDAVETFTAAIALAVGAIPEGLPAAVTIILAIGVARMARRRAVVRHLPTVETLGSTTVICTDKTGTLTENQMTVEVIWTPDDVVEVTGTGYAPDGILQDCDGAPMSMDANAALRWSLIAGASCNDAALTHDDARWDIVGDPTEGAMLVVASKAGLDLGRLASGMPREAAIPFSSERQYMATLHRDGADRVVLAKGAVERVLELCSSQMGADGALRPLEPGAVVDAAEMLTARGLRVLATAVRVGGSPLELNEDTLPGDLAFTGLHAMVDPPRGAARCAVAACHTAGIDVKMITGDHAGTATAIAAQVGLLDDGGPGPGAVLTGPDLAALDAEDYSDAVDQATLFARVSPEQKLRLVQALQARGHVVAMTGDGVNDAPALRQASVGVAMGRSGTEVAKDAADMVLTDDDFATIEAAVEEGRGVFDNLTKFITWTLPTNIGEGLVILAAIAFGTALPILPTQILWINMTTAIALGLMLAFEPKEAAIMSRPPRDPDQPLLTRTLVGRILLVSTLLVASAWWLFEWEVGKGASVEAARTAALNLFVVVEAFYLFSCRSLTRSAWRIGFWSNRWIIFGVAAQAIAQLAITYLPAMNAVFATAPIGAPVWLRIFGVATVVSLVVAADKLVRRIAPAQRR